MGQGTAAGRGLALVLTCLLLSGCGEDPKPSSPDVQGNDHSNRAGWEVTPDGVGPLELGWTVVEALDSGLFETPEPDADDPCPATTPELVGDYVDPDTGDGVLYVNWAYDGPDHVAGFLLKGASDFHTPEDVGVGSEQADLEAAYGDRLVLADIDAIDGSGTTQVPVVYGEDGGALVFGVRDGVVATMQVLVWRPGEALVDSVADGC